jgi:multiple sugar transport system permease protein
VPVVFFVGIRFYPAAEAFRASFTNWNIVGRMEFIGLANYVRLAQDATFWKVIGNTFAYLALGVPISMLLSFVVAYFLDRVHYGHGLLRALYFIPHLTTAVAMAWVWRWFYQPPPVGAFNVWLTALGFGQMPFLRSTTQALPAVLAPAIWAGIGFQIVIFLAGLKAIPRTYYEAAAIDGASAWRVLLEITLPSLRPTIVFLVVTSSIAYLRIFDYVYAMTNGQGGPLDATKPLVLKIFETAFSRFEMGYAATQTVVLFAILLVISLLQLKLLKSR